MDPLDRYGLPPTPPRGGRRGRRNVSPVWWKLSDENSHSVGGPGKYPQDKSSTQYGSLQEMVKQLRHPVQSEARDPVDHADKTKHGPEKPGNRLRRRTAVASLSKQYLESEKCNTSEHHETHTAPRQTILPTISADASRNWAKYRASRRFPLSIGTNQDAKNEISSGTSSRQPSAQTEATTTSEACLSDDKVDSAGQQNGRKTNFTIGPGEKDTWTRPSIASDDAASIRVVGDARAHIRRVQQHSETPELPPQRAECLNAHSSDARYESLVPTSRRDLSSADNHAGEQRKSHGFRPSTAGSEIKLSAPAVPKHQIWGQAAMRVETSPRREWSGHEDDLVKLAAKGRWGDQSNPKKWLSDADSSLSQRPEASSRVPQQGNGTVERPRHSEKLPLVPGIPADAQSRSGCVLGRAQAVTISKPGEVRLVKLPAKKSPPFNINYLSSEEADLMASMGAVARSSRHNSVWADGEKCDERGSWNIDAAAETLLPEQGLQPSCVPRVMPWGKEGAACSSKQSVDEESRDGQEDGRFHQRVRRLETNDHKTSRGVRHEGPTMINPSSELEHDRGSSSLGGPRQIQGPIGDGPVRSRQLARRLERNYPASTLPLGIPGHENPNPRDSGCPSLISDDGRESTASAGDMAYELSRAQIIQEPQGISGWETDETASTVAPHEAPSKCSLDLFDISTDENELGSREDTGEDDNDETASGGNGGGRWYREPQAPTSSFSYRHDNNFHSHLPERRPVGSAAGTHPSELGLYARCALLRWMYSTADAPDNPGMHDESGRWWELLRLEDSYQPRYGDETRAEILRALRFVSGAEKTRPELSPDARAFLRGLLPPLDA